jgi:hypothetical protein
MGGCGPAQPQWIVGVWGRGVKSGVAAWKRKSVEAWERAGGAVPHGPWPLGLIIDDLLLTIFPNRRSPAAPEIVARDSCPVARPHKLRICTADSQELRRISRCVSSRTASCSLTEPCDRTKDERLRLTHDGVPAEIPEICPSSPLSAGTPQSDKRSWFRPKAGLGQSAKSVEGLFTLRRVGYIPLALLRIMSSLEQSRLGS